MQGLTAKWQGENSQLSLSILKYICVIFCSPSKISCSLCSNLGSANNWLCDLGSPLKKKMLAKFAPSPVSLSLSLQYLMTKSKY